MHPSPEQLALLALGEPDSLTPTERRHVEGCSICMTEVADLARVVAVGRGQEGGTELMTPPPRVWDRILAEVTADGPPLEVTAAQAWPAASPSLDGAGLAGAASFDNPVTTSSDRTRPTSDRSAGPGVHAAVSPLAPRRRRSRRWALVALAAALALVVGGAAGYGIGRARQPGMTVLAQAQLAATPSWSGSTGAAVLRRNAEGQRILTLDLQASKPLSGIQAVWLIDPSRPNDPMPVGLLDLSEGIWSVSAGVDLDRYRIIDVSEEPANDTDPRHSGNSIVRGSLA